ncbi:hypothetical protein [Leisingera sp. F5]|uniref:hypothetical protein n=1 Tax=Leisingera sp. F5 TaxID=1813816 RepID=UPI0025C6B8B4|nr:hypothetical protein [Leisingera sp. F5]
MTTSVPKTLHLPQDHQVLLDQLIRNEEHIRVLHPLLALLETPERDSKTLAQGLLSALLQISEDLRLGRQQQEANHQQMAALERKLDSVLTILNLPLE